MKNIIINSEKIIWAKIVEPYPSSRFKWYNEFKPNWVSRNIFREKISPAGFYCSGKKLTDEEFNKMYFISGEVLMVKPHVKLNIQDVGVHEEFFDTMMEAESFFKQVKSTLPDYILCK